MFRPVGSQPPAVYWRRRLVLVAFLVGVVILAVLTVRAVASDGGGGGPPAAAATTGTTGSPRHTAPNLANDPPPRHGSHTPSAPSTAAGRSSGAGPSDSSSGPPARCSSSQLSVAAVTNKKSYAVGDRPVLMIQVSNKGPQPCVQDLADRQIVLRVYNGESRVWGSHDCQIEPGTDDRTLEVGRAVRRSIVWSGLSSQPKCAGSTSARSGQ